MMKKQNIFHIQRKSLAILLMVFMASLLMACVAKDKTIQDEGEEDYKILVELIQNPEKAAELEQIRDLGLTLDLTNNEEQTFEGNLRYIKREDETGTHGGLYILREENGRVYILNLPKDFDTLTLDPDSPYATLQDSLNNRMIYSIKSAQSPDQEADFYYAELTKVPYRKLFNRIFFISVVIFLFFIMLGMGMTLTIKDFILVFKDPRGIIIGPILQFGLLPLLAYLLCVLAGFEAYPFVFAGVILVTSNPGGVVSNLFTYWGKGDLALSISMTAVATVLSIFATPLLLTLYASDLPDVELPIFDIFQQILVLVLIPLAIGLLIRTKAENFAKKTEKFSSALGVLALLFIIVAGIVDNINEFADTERYGLKFYAVVASLPLIGISVSAIVAKILKIKNYQIRAIGLETGFRNATLAMTIALLLQDRVGDFHSSLFYSCGLYGLVMYPTGIAMMFLFRKILPVKESEMKPRD